MRSAVGSTGECTDMVRFGKIGPANRHVGPSGQDTSGRIAWSLPAPPEGEWVRLSMRLDATPPNASGSTVAAKVTLDDNALFRHADNAGLRDPSAEDPQEQMAHERGLTYVKLDGDIGILGNGAGLVMSTLDVVAQYGGAPANFLDAGGGSKADAVTSAVEVILSNPNVKAVLFNIFGGITRGDEVANGLVAAFAQVKPTVPFVVRLDGTNDKEGRALLAEADLPNVHTEATMLGAAKKVVELANG